MCYKLEIQKRNAAKLQRKFEENNVPEFIRRYFIRLKSKKGAINYWTAIKDLFEWLLDNEIVKSKTISKLSPNDFLNVEAEDIILYLEKKEQDGMSPTTLETRRHIFSSFWNYLVSTERCPVGKNIINDVTYRGIKTSSNLLVRKMPTEEQLFSMEQKINIKNDEFVRIRNLAIFHLFRGSGIRENELSGLDICDLYLNEEIPYIMVLRKGKYREIEKTPVYLTQKAVIYLKEWLELRDLLADVKDVEAVFLNKNKKRLNEKNVQSIFTSYGNGITPHMLRHYYATILANKGNVVFAQQQLGHSSQNTTIDNYALGIYGMKEFLVNM